jgi:hypothetical protein
VIDDPGVPPPAGVRVVGSRRSVLGLTWSDDPNPVGEKERTQMRSTLLRVGGATAGVTAVVAALAAPALGQQDPPGNNGTIKVDGVDFDSHPDNEPHVGCVFQIDFYNFDEGELNAAVTFEGQPPTGGGTLLTDNVFIGEDPAGGGNDLDASVTYDLSDALAGIEPHPVQGHHIQLTVEAEGSIGDETKHKVFWVEGCTTPPPSTTTTTMPGGTTTTTQPGGTTTTQPGTRGPGEARPAKPVAARPTATG